MTQAERDGTIPLQGIVAIRLLLLTGCRSSEIRTLRWQDVDFDSKCLRLPDSKTGAKVVYLNSAALQVLAGIERHDGHAYVFPGRKPGTPISKLTYYWQNLRKRSDLEDVRLHDLRHTFASFGVGLGLSLQLVGKLLGHSQITTTQIYAHLADDPVREANERIGEEIAALMSGIQQADGVDPASPAL